MFDLRDYTDKTGLKVAEILKAHFDKHGNPPTEILVNKVDSESTAELHPKVVRYTLPHITLFGIEEKAEQ